MIKEFDSSRNVDSRKSLINSFYTRTGRSIHKDVILFIVQNWNSSIEADFQKNTSNIQHPYFVPNPNFRWFSIADQKKMAEINNGILFCNTLLNTPTSQIKELSLEALRNAMLARNKVVKIQGKNMQIKLIEIQEYAAKYGNIEIG